MDDKWNRACRTTADEDKAWRWWKKGSILFAIFMLVCKAFRNKNKYISLDKLWKHNFICFRSLYTQSPTPASTKFDLCALRLFAIPFIFCCVSHSIFSLSITASALLSQHLRVLVKLKSWLSLYEIWTVFFVKTNVYLYFETVAFVRHLELIKIEHKRGVHTTN